MLSDDVELVLDEEALLLDSFRIESHFFSNITEFHQSPIILYVLGS